MKLDIDYNVIILALETLQEQVNDSLLSHGNIEDEKRLERIGNQIGMFNVLRNNEMKIDIRSDKSLYVTMDDVTFYIEKFGNERIMDSW